MPTPKRIFIVEDQAIIAADLADRLRKMGYEVAGTAISGEQAIEAIPGTQPHLVLMDIVLGGEMDGVKAAEILTQRDQIPVVFLTAHGDTATTERAQITGPFGYVLKPFDQRELRVAIEIALYRGSVEAELRRINRELQEALEKVKTLEGILPICAWCKKIRDEEGRWQTVERYLMGHSDAKLSHCICPDCEGKYRTNPQAAQQASSDGV